MYNIILLRSAHKIADTWRVPSPEPREPIIDFRLQRANRRYTCFNILMSYFFTIGISLLVIYPVNCIAQESTPDISAGINSKRQNYLSKVVSFRFSNCFIETDRAIISCQFRTKCVQVPPAPATDATSIIPPTGAIHEKKRW